MGATSCSRSGNQSGYTVIEVTLFLAISGLLFLIAVIGTGNTIRAVRFSDSGRALHAFVQKKYDDIINGVNPREGNEACNAGNVSTGSNQTPGTSNCLLMGKLLVFEQGSYQLNTYNIIGTEPAQVDLGKSDEDLVVDFAPKVVTNVGVADYDVPWEAAFSGFKRLSDNQATNALALIRSPRSTRILSYTYKTAPNSVDSNLLPIVGNTNNLGKTTNFCIKNADGFGPPAMLVATGGSNQSAMQLVFDATDGDCNGI